MAINRRQLLMGLGVGIGAAIAGGALAKLGQVNSNTLTNSNSATDNNAKSNKSQYETQAKTATNSTLLRFIGIADTGTGDDGQYAVADAMATYYKKNAYPLAILAGDNIYNNGEIEKVKAVFEEPYAPLLKAGVKFYAALGNHDIRTNNGEDQIRYKPFHMPSRYYTFREGPVQFFAIDTNVNSPWQEQLAWLDKTLSQSDAPWKIVFGHHPIYSSGFYGNNSAFIKDLGPLFAKYNVQLYLCGHDHDYERFLPINGTTYIVHGAGANTRPVARSANTAYSAAKRSFVAFEVRENEIVTEAIGTDGKVFDRGTIALKSSAKV